MPPVIKSGPNKGKRDHKREGRVERRNHPERKKARVARNQARAKAGLKPGDPREADHVTPLSKGGSNSKSNVRVVSKAEHKRKTKRQKQRAAKK
jgi:5-methylcytosine-specific restriction endonuclease McrA